MALMASALKQFEFLRFASPRTQRKMGKKRLLRKPQNLKVLHLHIELGFGIWCLGFGIFQVECLMPVME
jgi:hypothetical protein